MIRKEETELGDHRTPQPTDKRSSLAWRLGWVLTGFVAYLAAKYLFGF